MVVPGWQDRRVRKLVGVVWQRRLSVLEVLLKRGRGTDPVRVVDAASHASSAAARRVSVDVGVVAVVIVVVAPASHPLPGQRLHDLLVGLRLVRLVVL